MTVRVTKLSSGLTVATHAMDHLESAALGVWVGAGSRLEGPAEHGISHLLEHMAFKGTSRRSATDIAEEIEAVGGEVNAATSVETTSYYARILKDDAELAVDILSDILCHSAFDAAELAREQHVIVQEIGASLDTPEDRVFDFFIEGAFPEQPLGRTILGTEETVRRTRPDDLFSYLDRHYHGPSMVLSAAGAVDHDRIVAAAEAQFASLPSSAVPTPPIARYRGGDVRESRPLMEAQVLLGFEGLPYASDDFHAVQILAALLGGGMSSRLFQEVREKRGLCYSIYSFHWSFADTGLFGIHAATGAEDIPELMPVLLGELERAASDISEAELSRARAQLRASLLMSLESPAARAGQLARQMLLFGRPITTEELVARIDAVSVERVRRLAERIFTSGSPTMAAIGPIDKLIERDRIAERLGSRVEA
ncbi:putative Zn-dependent peptidase [Kaistia hirudinis]|uniref:Putative Zn-dependent peptidase n=1 Tax=Kaistia hirudinis TaxID=1293440 RepID=A0A840ANE4_9HYPH|nr:pitrilysin family protein [Kaistia hirudinis]MBB3930567.1 putative Zn-dependent peptidase [Kaistia hirudinis]MBN9017456.1 insulinase family protein [Hyphomicrobiales bacterium]